jgi:hypothetical protein
MAMLKSYGYLGILLIAFAEINFIIKIQPFASFYIPIVWYGYILFVDSLVYKIKKKSFISAYPKEFLLALIISVPFWCIFEVYNIFTMSWYYIHYTWTIHLVDFTTILPAVLETFTLMNAVGLAKNLDAKRKYSKKGRPGIGIIPLILFGALISILPVFIGVPGILLVWIGLFLFLDPLNYLLNKPSVLERVRQNGRGVMIRLLASGITMGFFWEFWNYQAYPKWMYIFASQAVPRLFEMPWWGYFGYFPFALEAFLFYAFFRSFLFKKKNESLGI